MKVALSQLLAAAQLAEMAYNADPADHKKDAWDKAQTEYEQAAEAERQERPAEPEPPKSDVAKVDELDTKYQALETENALLKTQLIEKDQKIAELEKLVSSAKATPPAAKKNS